MLCPMPNAIPAPRRRWRRAMALVCLGCIALVVVAYFTLTSSTFLKGVVLPRLGSNLNARVESDLITLRPFSGVVIRGLRLETTGSTPLLTLREGRVRYRFMPLLSGRLEVEELTLVEPAFSVQQGPDGTSNLDPLLRRATAAAPPGATPTTAGAPR